MNYIYRYITGYNAVTVDEAFKIYLIRGGFPFLYNYPFSEADAQPACCILFKGKN
ncbi:MAG: hypothetical protein JXK07_15250 [Spirochaetes bacterium]|nr:hypothetical protein [Spirochaetota bacterium]